MKKVLIIAIMALFLCGCVTLEDQRREQFIQSNPTLDEDIKKPISEGNIQIGMTEEQVIASWGEPRDTEDVHDLDYNNIGIEWRYGEWNSDMRDYLYFENGKLVDMGKTSMINNKRRERYIKQHPELSGHMKTWITRGYYELGMTEDQVAASVGCPSSRNRSTGTWGVHEQWVMKYGSSTYYLYFDNGILTSFQN